MLVNVLWRELVSILHDKNEKKYDVEPFDITQLLPCPPYCPPVINLPGPGLPLFPDKGKY